MLLAREWFADSAPHAMGVGELHILLDVEVKGRVEACAIMDLFDGSRIPLLSSKTPSCCKTTEEQRFGDVVRHMLGSGWLLVLL